MTETRSESADQSSATARTERRAGRQSGGSPERPVTERPAAERSFAGEARTDIPVRQVGDGGLQPGHDAAQAGRELREASQRAAAHTAEAWRQSWEPIATIQSEMNHWFDDMWRRMTGLGSMRPLQTARPFSGGTIMSLMGAPAADLKETDTAYRLCLEVPGVKPEELEIGVRGDALVISGQKSEERREGADAYHVSERRYGAFERSFPVPPDVDRARIEARLEHGLLKVDLPRTEKAEPAWSRIEVKS
jgi:HSP20 family protein